MKQLNAGSSLAQKTVYDGIGRPTYQYSSYNTSETGYPYPIDISGDTVMQQMETSYDEAGNLVSTATRERFHNATGTGALTTPGGSQPKARASYAAAYPDPINRQIAVANHGTNGASSWSRSDTIPAGSDTILVSQTAYNSRGEAYQATDPQGTVTQSTFDDAGRTTQLLENYVSGGTGVDQNRETDYSYNPDGKIATLTAKNSVTGNQVTQFVYGTTLTESDVASNELLVTKIYPDDTTGSRDRIAYAYNRLGQMKQQTDQNGTVREFDYDELGRLQHDRVTTLGGGVDDTVLRISRTYEVRGMLQNATSYDNATVGSGTVVNDVQFGYNSFQQLQTDYQSHSGAVNTSTSPKVQYGYADGSANTVRATSLTYPDTRAISYDYGTSSGMNDLLSRLAAIKESSNSRAAYSYLGLGVIVQIDESEPSVKMTYIKQGSEPVGDAGDQYIGLDRFGRLVDSRWIDSTPADINRVQYGYSAASNKVWRQNIVQTTGQDEFYTYDGLYQLGDLQRGTLNGTNTGISGTPDWEEDFTYDPIGNWQNYLTKVSGSTTLDQDRTQNKVNETTSIANSSSLVAYDKAGNMTTTPQPVSWGDGYTLTWDAWNRLVSTFSGGSPVATYAYDGLNRRIIKDTGSAQHYYYSAAWQVLEERAGSSSSADRQFLWGLQGIDDLIFRETFSGSTQRFYAMDDGMSVTAIGDTSGSVQERYGYNAFGSVNFMDASFGSISSSSYGWETLFCSYRWDIETGFYQVRNRYMHAQLGRWLSRDPIGERGGMNLYSYIADKPTNYSDPYGLDPDTNPNAWAIISQLMELHFNPSAVGIDGVERISLDDLKKQMGGNLSELQQTELALGCIGLCMAYQNAPLMQSGKPPKPENAPDTKCYLEKERADQRPCKKGEYNFVFAKQSAKWTGGTKPIPNADGTIPNNSVSDNNNLYNYITTSGSGDNTTYAWMNNNADPRFPDQQASLLNQQPNLGPKYSNTMWCSTCQCKPKSNSLPSAAPGAKFGAPRPAPPVL